MKIHCSYDELIPLYELKQHPLNRNTHPEEQINRLCDILTYQGVRKPITVSKRSGYITAGHGRLMAALKLGMPTFPVNFQEYKDEAQEYADLTADNAIASWAEIDLSGVNLDIQDLGPELDIDMLGIKDFKIDCAEKDAKEDEIPEQVPAKTKLGDLYLLGDHRLLCGDSTDIVQVEKLMNGEKADMVFTDPPYGMNLDADYSTMDSKLKGSSGGNEYKNVIGDHEDFSPELINTVFAAFSYAKEIFMWGADYYSEHILDKSLGSWIVWDKRGDESADKMYGSCFEMCWSKARHKRDIARIKWAGIFGMEKGHDKKRVHPTQKPVLLVEWFFERWGKAQDKVVDLFGGSGSTLIACEKTKRKCFMMELDPHYCDVIVARWEKYADKKAQLMRTEP